MNFSEIDAWLAEAEALRQRDGKAYVKLLEKIYREAFPEKSSWKSVSGLTRQFEKARGLVMEKRLCPTDPVAQTLASVQESLQNALFPFARRMEPLVRSLVFKALFEAPNAPGLPREMSGWNAEAKGALIADIGTSLQFIVLRMARRFQSLWEEAVKETQTKEERDYFVHYQALWERYEVLLADYKFDPEMIYVGGNPMPRNADLKRKRAREAAVSATLPRDPERDPLNEDLKKNLKERAFAFDDQALLPANGAKWMRFAAVNYAWHRRFLVSLRGVVLTQRALGIDLLLRTEALAESFYRIKKNEDFAIALDVTIKAGEYWSRAVPPKSRLKLGIQRAMTTERDMVRRYLELCGPTCYWTRESAHLHDPVWKDNVQEHFEERRYILARYDEQVVALS